MNKNVKQSYQNKINEFIKHNIKSSSNQDGTQSDKINIGIKITADHPI